jgi:hypothetical protein
MPHLRRYNFGAMFLYKHCAPTALFYGANNTMFKTFRAIAGFQPTPKTVIILDSALEFFIPIDGARHLPFYRLAIVVMIFKKMNSFDDMIAMGNTLLLQPDLPNQYCAELNTGFESSDQDFSSLRSSK